MVNFRSLNLSSTVIKCIYIAASSIGQGSDFRWII